jgi:hypothetical protein
LIALALKNRSRAASGWHHDGNYPPPSPGVTSLNLCADGSH